MSEQTLRTFTLNYYRQQGAQATPVDTQRRRWEIRLGDRKLDLTFDPGAAAEAMVPGSVHWREILSDCASRGAVSYRHVVTAPINDPAAVLTPAIPENWSVKAVRLGRVTTRRAVAFTHRVTYGAPAFGGQPEELHHDALDAETGGRMPRLSEGLAKLATIPVSAPAEVTALDDLHARALALVDARSSDRGKGIEMTLEIKQVEAAKRISTHYSALRSETQAREVADLSARLAKVLEQIPAVLPGDLNRMKEEGASLAKRLDQARKGRSVAVKALEKVEADSLAAERDRHEVTITTELVGICIVSYDQVTYEVELARRVSLTLREVQGPSAPAPLHLPGAPKPRTTTAGSDRVLLDIDFVPVLNEVHAPPCTACGETCRDPVVTDTGRYTCRSCACPCVGCGRTAVSGEDQPAACHSCSRSVCGTCGVPCVGCGLIACEAHASACGGCAQILCAECSMTCTTCQSPLCSGCAREVHRRTYCADHVSICERCQTEIPGDLVQRCHLTSATYCLACALACVECGMVTQRSLLKSSASGRGLVCPDHMLPCGTCKTSLMPRDANFCPSCGRHHCAHEAPTCTECGLSCCLACHPDDDDRCAVCTDLELADESDDRLAAAKAALGDISANTWLVAESNGYVVAEWHGRLGSWGRVAVSPTGEVLSLTKYGAFKAFFQEMAGLVGK